MTFPWADDDLTRDGFLGGRLHLWQPQRGYRAGTDPVFLAAAVPARAGQSVLELGTGVGTSILCLATRVPGLDLAGVELQPGYATLARRNATEADIAIAIYEADLRDLPQELRARRFDHVMMNPPYYPARGRTRSSDPGRERALGEDTPLVDWIGAALRRLAPGGQLTLIQDAARLPDILGTLGPIVGTIAVRPLASRMGRAASRVIVSARREGSGFTLSAPEVIHGGEAHGDDGDDYAPASSAVLRDGSPWPWIAN